MLGTESRFSANISRLGHRKFCCGNSILPGLILGWHPANERRRYNVTPSLMHWLGANLESALYYNWPFVISCYWIRSDSFWYTSRLIMKESCLTVTPAITRVSKCQGRAWVKSTCNEPQQKYNYVWSVRIILKILHCIFGKGHEGAAVWLPGFAISMIAKPGNQTAATPWSAHMQILRFHLNQPYSKHLPCMQLQEYAWLISALIKQCNSFQRFSF